MTLLHSSAFERSHTPPTFDSSTAPPLGSFGLFQRRVHRDRRWLSQRHLLQQAQRAQPPHQPRGTTCHDEHSACQRSCSGSQGGDATLGMGRFGRRRQWNHHHTCTARPPTAVMETRLRTSVIITAELFEPSNMTLHTFASLSHSPHTTTMIGLCNHIGDLPNHKQGFCHSPQTDRPLHVSAV